MRFSNQDNLKPIKFYGYDGKTYYGKFIRLWKRPDFNVCIIYHVQNVGDVVANIPYRDATTRIEIL